MFKKMMLLAGMALAVVAVAGPASASASWLNDHKAIEADETVTASGPAAFAIPGVAGASAKIHVNLEMTAGKTTGEITSFSATECLGTGGFTGLTCTTEPRNLPWTVHITAENTIEITDVELHNEYYLGAHIPANTKATTILVGDILATPDNAQTMSTLTLSNINATANGNAVTVTGDQTLSPAGTYGIEG
ncbi:MAG: hypothetical protein JJE35_01820 [Thermoleophilia bacterium]|nr:hypothetical protein [Thermoleophilia bacterium]